MPFSFAGRRIFSQVPKFFPRSVARVARLRQVARAAITDHAVDCAEVLFKQHGIETVATYDTVSMEAEIGITSAAAASCLTLPTVAAVRPTNCLRPTRNSALRGGGLGHRRAGRCYVRRHAGRRRPLLFRALPGAMAGRTAACMSRCRLHRRRRSPRCELPRSPPTRAWYARCKVHR